MPHPLDPDHNEVPEHVEMVRNMSSEILLHEAESVYALPAVEPEREIPDSFRDNYGDPED